MRITPKLVSLPLLVLALTLSAMAQRPRSSTDTTTNSATPAPSPAPQSFKAKYEGGIFGYNKKQDGTLSFDDVNNRLVFRDEHQKEILFIPYSAVSQEFADTQSRVPKSASILGAIPMIYGPNPIGYIKTKNQYVTIQFFDQDSHVNGITSFRVENKDLCASVVATLAEKAGLSPQGVIFVRRGNSNGTTPVGPATGQANTKPTVLVENENLSSRVISLPRPVYPDDVRQQKIGGTVRVLATIDEKGVVTDAEAVSGPPPLHAAAVDAAKLAVFEPLMKDGRPSKTKTVIAYNFAVN